MKKMIILFAVIYSVEAKCELHFDLILIQTKTCLLRSYLNKLRATTGQSSINSEFSGFSGMLKRGRMLARSIIFSGNGNPPTQCAGETRLNGRHLNMRLNKRSDGSKVQVLKIVEVISSISKYFFT